MDNVEEVEKELTKIIWVASALHATINFGKYPYVRYMPDRPTISRRLIPKEGSQEFSDLVENLDLFFLGMVSNQFQTTLVIALI
jgi:linoleate 9S-lipoxygenase